MFDNVLRFAAGAVAAPVGMALGALRGMAGSHGVVLEVVVDATSELCDRQVLLDDLDLACADERVLAAVFRFDGSPAGWAAASDVRAAVTRLRQRRVLTVALVENPGNVGLWLASACECVVMVPSGQVMATGVGAELTFFGRTLDRLGLMADVEAAGEYKAAGETVTRAYASPENREATRSLVDGLHAQLVEGLSVARKITTQQVDEALEMAPLSAEEAREHGLVDELMYPDQLREWLEQRVGARARRVSLNRWARLARLERRLGRVGRWPGVAVLHLQGPIVLDSRPGAVVIAARDVVPILRELTEAEGVAGVVLHVNSPGGSAYASDLIWREVERMGRDKPVVACFEDVSASGGYYLSAPATHIVARPQTITGSIGVVGGKLVVSGAQRALGVTVESIAATSSATMFSASAPFTPAQRARFRASLDTTYDAFVHRVASGRRRPLSTLEPHCRGRVWLGVQAKEVGLVDSMGDLNTAIHQVERLASRTGLARYDLTGHERPGFLARQVQRHLRDALPVGVSVVAQLPGMSVGPALTAFALSQGEPLALWPVDLATGWRAR